MISTQHKDTGLLNLLAENPPQGTLAIIGGTRVREKLPLVSLMIKKAATIMLGGEIAYTFMASRGIQTGGSPVDLASRKACGQLLDKAESVGVKVLLPIDHIAAIKLEPNVTIKMIRENEEIPDNMTGYDLGFDTINYFSKQIEMAELIIFYGPLGVFEIDTFSAGTMETLKSIAKSNAHSIIIGEKLVEATQKAGVSDRFSYVSKESKEALSIINR